MVKPPNKFLGKPKALQVHRVVVFLESSTNVQVPFVRCCPSCLMPEFNVIVSEYGGSIICKTCFHTMEATSQLVRFGRLEYVRLVKSLPLLNNGKMFPLEPGEEEKDVSYRDLSLSERMILDSYFTP